MTLYPVNLALASLALFVREIVAGPRHHGSQCALGVRADASVAVAAETFYGRQDIERALHLCGLYGLSDTTFCSDGAGSIFSSVIRSIRGRPSLVSMYGMNTASNDRMPHSTAVT